MAELYGTDHRRLIDWLEKDWWPNGPAICVIDGFPGVGKTRIAEELLTRLGTTPTMAPMIECPVAYVGLLDDLMLDLAETMASRGDQRSVPGKQACRDSTGLSTLTPALGWVNIVGRRWVSLGGH